MYRCCRDNLSSNRSNYESCSCDFYSGIMDFLKADFLSQFYKYELLYIKGPGSLSEFKNISSKFDVQSPQTFDRCPPYLRHAVNSLDSIVSKINEHTRKASMTTDYYKSKVREILDIIGGVESYFSKCTDASMFLIKHRWDKYFRNIDENYLYPELAQDHYRYDGSGPMR